ncbi:MAG: 5' nucleotidase, NT5C type [Candidatus Actinomarina sp.]|jgi:5'(3')-deoxyribonucleotidase
MRIGVDLDGVVADFTQGWTSQYKIDFNKEIREEDIVEWGLSKPLTHFEEEIDFWNWARDFNGSSIFRNLKTYENAVEVLYEVSKSGHEVVIISSKPWWSIHDTLIWLGENKIPSKEIHFLEDKWRIDCDVYIDDAPHQLKNFVENVPDKLILRFVRPYNKPVAGTKDLSNWLELNSLLESYNL